MGVEELMSELIQHVKDTWDHVLHGNSSTAEKVEVGAETVGLGIAAVAASRLGLSKFLPCVENTNALLPQVEIIGSVPATLADVPQIMKSGVSFYTRATIPEIVEAPLVKASTQLYDKNIQTVFSGANGIANGPDLPAYIHIDYETLSDANKAIARRLGEIIPANGHSSTTIAALELPVEATSSVSHIEAEFLKMSAQFERQPLTWGHWSAAQYKEMSGIENDAEVKDFADFYGHKYSPELSRVFETEERAGKYTESLHW
jgi:hypothetical protein